MIWGKGLERERDSCARGRVTREVRPVSVVHLDGSGPSTASRTWQGGVGGVCMQYNEQLVGVGKKTPKLEVGLGRLGNELGQK